VCRKEGHWDLAVHDYSDASWETYNLTTHPHIKSDIDAEIARRKNIADELGIANYKGSGDQNTQLLEMLKNSATSANNNQNKQNTPKPSSEEKSTVKDIVKPAVNANTTATVVTAPVVTAPALTSSSLQGVDESIINTLNSTFAPSANVAGAQNSANNALNILTGMATPSVSKDLMDKINSQFNASSNLTSAQQNANNALDILTGMSAPSVSADVMQALNTPFNASSAYLEAMNYTNSLLEKLSSGRTSYTDQIKDMMNKIQNRDKFSYDVDTDVLFQQALASSMGSGKQAMQDTMGQASALTGGYASTYAQSAGNQAYNAYIEDAYNNLPEYYQMAMDAYNMEGQDMYNQLSMLSDADATEYGRMYDSWNANFTQAQNMYNQEYGAWQDSVNNAYNNANLQLKEQGMAYDQAYTNYNALSNQAQTLYQNEYTKWQDMVNNAYNVANMQNKDYWSGVDNQYRYDSMANDNYWNEIDNTYRYDALLQDDTHFNASLTQDNEKFLAELGQDNRQFKEEMLYKNVALAQDKNLADRDYNAKYDVNRDGKVDASDNVTEEEGFTEPTPTQKQKALEAYNTGGEDAYYQYIDSLPSDIDVEAIDLYVNGDGGENKGYGTWDTKENPLPLEKRTWTKKVNTKNHLGGLDKNDQVIDQYGNQFYIRDLPEELWEELSKLGLKESYTAK
jgi:hypothetical protein